MHCDVREIIPNTKYPPKKLRPSPTIQSYRLLLVVLNQQYSIVRGLRRAVGNFHSFSRVWPTVASSETTSKTSGACESQQPEEWVVLRVRSLPAEDVVCQLGPLHGSPLALSLTISPLHILPLPQVKGFARESTLGRSSQQDGYSSTWIGGGRPAERAGHFITGGVGGGASTVARPPL